MFKKLIPGFNLLCACLFLNVGHSFATSNCSGFDISFTSVRLTGVGNSQITYNVTIKNSGTQTLDLSKITLQNYVSTDDTYDAGDADGGASTPTGTTLLAGQELETSFYSNYSGDIKSLPYLILQLSYQDAECDVTNNQIVVCTRPNAVFNSLNITGIISSSEADFNFEIQNTGGDTLFLSSLVLQSYVSTDNVLDGGDPAAGGAVLTYGGKYYLVANEKYQSSYGAYCASITSYSYVISTLGNSKAECTTSDNNIIRPLVVTAIQNMVTDVASNMIIWDMNSHSFITKDQGDVVWSGILTYKVLDTAGRLLNTGKTNPGERVYIQEGSGMGLLLISDDQHFYSKKIMR
ncbi:MAG: hypothetical protein JWO58_89 [Chitinophagaceae bacterium]|nr:hypothetical protein [Chitinophagaceae bacterium]